MRYGSVTVSAENSLISRVVQSAMPSDLAARVNAAIAALPAGYVVVGLTLAGGGKGHTFTVEIEAGLTANVSGGFQAAAPVVACFLASEAEALLLARIQASPAIGQVFADTQVAGSSDGTRFMGMVVRGAIANALTYRTSFDQVVDTQDPVAAGDGQIPRNGAGDPMQAVLTGITPGNYIRIGWRMTLQNDSASPGLVGFRGIVSFAATPIFPDNFFQVLNTNGGDWVYDADSKGSMSAFGYFLIPDGVSEVRARLLYSADNAFFVAGKTAANVEGCSIEITELSPNAVSVPQPDSLCTLDALAP